MDSACRKEIFMPQETRECPCDVTLVVEDGKEFKAHRQVLSKSSPFFDKLLNSDMRESKEGVVRLEMLNESCLGDILECIYTGSVQILDEENARDLIEMADYLFLPQLKYLAGKVVIQKLDISHCISTYYFAERYQCEELVTDAKRFILANFTTVVKAKEFRNMSSKEVEMWISSDEIDVSSEEDVFKIILEWIDHDKSERTKYFADLFRHVRLVYVSRDYLSCDIVTNDLVKGSECCFELVKDVMKSIDSKNADNISVPPPRKALETPVIVVCVQKKNKKPLCYFPSKNMWYKFTDTSPLCDHRYHVVSCHGKLYFISKQDSKLLCYDSLFDQWTSLPYKRNRDLQQIFVKGDDGIYALESENQISCPDCAYLRSRVLEEVNGPVGVGEHVSCGKQHLGYITKYKPESNLWEDLSTFDLGSRKGICIVANDNYIYFIGGHILSATGSNRIKILTDVDMYDLSKSKWEKKADIQEARDHAYGTAANGKIFITGGSSRDDVSTSCEVYDETTNEWQFIAGRILVGREPRLGGRMMCVNDKIYVLDGYVWPNVNGLRGRIECYDPGEGKWNEITNIPAVPSCAWYNSCPMRVFNGVNINHQWTHILP